MFNFFYNHRLQKNHFAWLTDIHLDRIAADKLTDHILKFQSKEADAFLITGDISNSQQLNEHLEKLATLLNKKIYFVLGNHDFYQSSVEETHEKIKALCEQHKQLIYLPSKQYIELDSNTALLGQDTWADARLSNIEESNLVNRIQDPNKIENLKKTRTIGELKQAMQTLADADAAALKIQIEAAIQTGKSNILIACHVPPFAEACQGETHEGEPKDYLPFLASKATGDVIKAFSEMHPECQFTVFCGHTHVKKEHIENNLKVFCGEVPRHTPKVQGLYKTQIGFEWAEPTKPRYCPIL
jgi:predicted MPP superfamily phosphohydrolase